MTDPVDRRAFYARPEDPRTNTRPPGNGDPEDGALARSIEHLMAVLGR